MTFLDRLRAGPVLGDGGYLIELERRMYVRGNNWVPEVILDHPEAVSELHREFLRAGSEVLQALTFWTTRNILEGQASRGDEAERANRQAVHIARQAAGDRALVAGTLTATTLMGTRDRSCAPRGAEAEAGLARSRKVLEEQARWLVDEGVDLIVAETFDRLDEVLVAVDVTKALDVPVVATMSWREIDEISTDGFPIDVCALRLREAGADVVGFNCRQEPEKALAVLRQIRKVDDGPLAAQPWGLTSLGRAGVELRPGLLAGNEVDPDVSEGIQIDRQSWSDFAVQAGDLGISYLGACCGAGPSAVFGMAEALGKPTWLS